ncbi:18450_t:CDS:2, partial [Gigaspora rosea]
NQALYIATPTAKEPNHKKIEAPYAMIPVKRIKKNQALYMATPTAKEPKHEKIEALYATIPNQAPYMATLTAKEPKHHADDEKTEVLLLVKKNQNATHNNTSNETVKEGIKTL